VHLSRTGLRRRRLAWQAFQRRAGGRNRPDRRRAAAGWRRSVKPLLSMPFRSAGATSATLRGSCREGGRRGGSRESTWNRKAGAASGVSIEFAPDRCGKSSRSRSPAKAEDRRAAGVRFGSPQEVDRTLPLGQAEHHVLRTARSVYSTTRSPVPSSTRTPKTDIEPNMDAEDMLSTSTRCALALRAL
jgi:hypothetical protein